MEKFKFWLYHNAIAIDQLFNTLLGGCADETLSSRTYRGAILARQPKKRWRVSFRVIESLFFWERGNHCKQAYQSELSRKQYPKAFRQKS